MAENKKYKILNGIKVEMTPEEITAMQAEQAKAEAYERTAFEQVPESGGQKLK